MVDSANEGRGLRPRNRYWPMVVGVAIAAGVGIILFFRSADTS